MDAVEMPKCAAFLITFLQFKTAPPLRKCRGEMTWIKILHFVTVILLLELQEKRPLYPDPKADQHITVLDQGNTCRSCSQTRLR